MRMYEDKEYAVARLTGTIVLNVETKQPVYIDGFARDYANVRTLLTGEELKIKLNKLDITPVQLGYVKVGKEYYYLSRIPKRDDWRQGLRNNTMVIRNNLVHPEGIEWANLALCIMGVYPNLRDCIPGVAFHRDFKFSKDGTLMYKDLYPVGEFLDVGERRYTLYPQFNWIRETLEEAILA